jgi:hypothetical protein
MWHPDKCTLFQHLAGVIASSVSHRFSSSDGKLIVRDSSSSGFSDGWPPELMDEAPNPEQIQESQSTLQDLLEHLDRKDPMMRKMAELHMRGIDATQDLSRELDLPPAEIANLRRRMTRVARAYGLEQQP